MNFWRFRGTATQEYCLGECESVSKLGGADGGGKEMKRFFWHWENLSVGIELSEIGCLITVSLVKVGLNLTHVVSTTTKHTADGQPIISGVTKDGALLHSGIFQSSGRLETATIITTTTTTYKSYENTGKYVAKENITSPEAATNGLKEKDAKRQTKPLTKKRSFENIDNYNHYSGSIVNMSKAREIVGEPIENIVHLYHSGHSLPHLEVEEQNIEEEVSSIIARISQTIKKGHESGAPKRETALKHKVQSVRESKDQQNLQRILQQLQNTVEKNGNQGKEVTSEQHLQEQVNEIHTTNYFSNLAVYQMTALKGEESIIDQEESNRNLPKKKTIDTLQSLADKLNCCQRKANVTYDYPQPEQYTESTEHLRIAKEINAQPLFHFVTVVRNTGAQVQQQLEAAKEEAVEVGNGFKRQSAERCQTVVKGTRLHQNLQTHESSLSSFERDELEHFAQNRGENSEEEGTERGQGKRQKIESDFSWLLSKNAPKNGSSKPPFYKGTFEGLSLEKELPVEPLSKYVAVLKQGGNQPNVYYSRRVDDHETLQETDLSQTPQPNKVKSHGMISETPDYTDCIGPNEERRSELCRKHPADSKCGPSYTSYAHKNTMQNQHNIEFSPIHDPVTVRHTGDNCDNPNLETFLERIVFTDDRVMTMRNSHELNYNQLNSASVTESDSAPPGVPKTEIHDEKLCSQPLVFQSRRSYNPQVYNTRNREQEIQSAEATITDVSPEQYTLTEKTTTNAQNGGPKSVFLQAELNHACTYNSPDLNISVPKEHSPHRTNASQSILLHNQTATAAFLHPAATEPDRTPMLFQRETQINSHQFITFLPHELSPEPLSSHVNVYHPGISRVVPNHERTAGVRRPRELEGNLADLVTYKSEDSPYPRSKAYAVNLSLMPLKKELEHMPIHQVVDLHHSGTYDYLPQKSAPEPTLHKEKREPLPVFKSKSFPGTQRVLQALEGETVAFAIIPRTFLSHELSQDPLSSAVDEYHSGISAVPVPEERRKGVGKLREFDENFADLVTFRTNEGAYSRSEPYLGDVSCLSVEIELEHLPLKMLADEYHSGTSCYFLRKSPTEPPVIQEKEEPVLLSKYQAIAGTQRVLESFTREKVVFDIISRTSLSNELSLQPISSEVNVYHSGISIAILPKDRRKGVGTRQEFQEKLPEVLTFGGSESAYPRSEAYLGDTRFLPVGADLEHMPIHKVADVYHSGTYDYLSQKPLVDITVFKRKEEPISILKHEPVTASQWVPEAFKGDGIPFDIIQRTLLSNELCPEPLSSQVHVYHSGISYVTVPEERRKGLGRLGEFEEKLADLVFFRTSEGVYPRSQPYLNDVHFLQLNAELQHKPIHQVVVVYHTGTYDYLPEKSVIE
ncbi:unnamed protein product, partial [Enterobius vermicularis]|uniref:Xin actin-binding repeat-containing protein 2 n=1 Tax=Enterobius vermicularis TaxID=51028 RepID=A0A0N4V3C3_ENTVE